MAVVLHGMKTELARQVEESTALLLVAADQPKTLPRPFIELGKNYGMFVQKAVRVITLWLIPKPKVWQHRGMLLVSRAFAVPSDDKEASTSGWF